MTSKDYNALAADMMGYKRSDILLPGEYVHQYAEGDFMRWNPLQDRNQAHQLLKRAEELGLAEGVVSKLVDLDNPIGFDEIWSILTDGSELIVKACVDVWEGTKENA